MADRRTRTALWTARLAAPASILVAIIVALEAGVDFSQRPGIPDASLAVQLYYAVGLFFYGGLDLGVPTGGPTGARMLMWGGYFLAPLVTATAVVEGALRLFSPAAFAHPLRNHTVIVGDSNLARQFLQKVEARHLSVVWVTRLQDHGNHDPNARVVFGDIRSGVLTDKLRLTRAKRVFLLTDDDFTNLNTATRLLEQYPELRDKVVVHVKDSRMVQAAGSVQALGSAQLFNTHRSAARRLVTSRLLPHFESTEPRDVLILAGFGRFGQALLAELQERLAGSVCKVVLVDLQCDLATRVFQTEIGFHSDYERVCIEADLKDPTVWDRITTIIQGHERPVFVMGSGDDATNIRTAIRLSATHEDATILVRTFENTTFGEHAGRQCGFEVLSLADLLDESMPETWWTE